MGTRNHGEAPATAPRGEIRNVHGRRPGRGLRPYLIVLKILSVAAFFGGLAAVVMGVLFGPEPLDAAGWRADMVLVHRVYAGVIIPGLLAALVFGTLLFVTIWQVMVRMRWFVTKMILIAVGVPALHIYMRSRSVAMEALLALPSPDLQQASDLRAEMIAGTMLAMLLAVAAIILGRVKPRLGQDYGRTFARRDQPAA
jgi:hypothetical protein